jgi:Core-2/I-Branching enzyme
MATKLRNLAVVGITLFILIQFVATCAGRRIAPIQLAYGVMTYERAGQPGEETIEDFMRLMNQIYEDADNHIYVLHTDLKSSLFVTSHINAYCDSKVNCISIDSRSVTWGGVSVTEMNLALMHAADDFLYPNGTASSWDYFCLLGHESIPLTTLEYTEQFLLSYPKGTNFINCWKAEGHDFFGQWESLQYRLARVVIDSTGENILHEPNIERSVPPGLEIYKSLQYVVLSREFIR